MKHKLVTILTVLMLAMGLPGAALGDTSVAPVLAPTSTYYVANTTAECSGYSCWDVGPNALKDLISGMTGSDTIIVIGAYQSNSEVVINVGRNITLQPLNGSASLRQTGSCPLGRLLYVTGTTGDLTIDGLAIDGTGATCSIGVQVDVSGAVRPKNGASISNWTTGVHSSSYVRIENNSTLSGNGTALYVNGGTAEVYNSTLSSNTVDGIRVNAGTATIKNSTISSNGDDGVDINGGTVTIGGNTISSNTDYGVERNGGTVYAYANNFTGNKGGSSFQALVTTTAASAKNWWGTYSNSALGPTSDGTSSYTDGWNARLGADVESWVAGINIAILNDAWMRDGSGTAIIINMGRGSANAPFGNGVSPYVDQACSPFFDFYDLEGDGGSWTLYLPIDNTTDCNTNVLNGKAAYKIGNNSECSPASNPDCWDRIPLGSIVVGTNRLEISQTSAELSGTHIVAGNSSGGSDPTAITLRGFAAHTGVNTPVALSLGLLGMIVISLTLVWRARRS